VGTADVDGLGGFLAATHWKVIYGVNLKTSTPAAAAAEATYAASALGTGLYGFEIGNEVDLYGGSYAAFKTTWESFATAIRGAGVTAALTGPAVAAGGDYTGWTIPFAHDEASRITLLTQHYYRGDGQSSTSTMDQLLSPDPTLLTMLQALAAVTAANGITNAYRLAETNSYYNHGAPFVSDALGSALWAIDFLFTNALNGSTGVNFHGGGAGQDGPTPFLYTPIEESAGVVTNAQPIFYGMLLVTLAGTGNVLATTAAAGQLNFTAYAVAQADQSTNIVLVNKDATNAVQATIHLGASVAAATGIFLQGPSLAARTGVTLAGTAITAAGAWAPASTLDLPVSGSTVTVLVPPASAAMVHAK
jgi:hypothetical protein